MNQEPSATQTRCKDGIRRRISPTLNLCLKFSSYDSGTDSHEGASTLRSSQKPQFRMVDTLKKGHLYEIKRKYERLLESVLMHFFQVLYSVNWLAQPKGN
ncbi:BA75_04334T0 [Komagataella pastoris]|uniref:BA75_04334T0 n=1 Tax=Komagataella pastoris TaxID=4922 RepID=A0A1B2JEH1_PICPA|nr:BA75_04334T0 [Komagataella pastoris]